MKPRATASWRSTRGPKRRGGWPRLEMQTIYPFMEEGIGRAVSDAMAMKTMKFTIVWPELVE